MQALIRCDFSQGKLTQRTTQRGLQHLIQPFQNHLPKVGIKPGSAQLGGDQLLPLAIRGQGINPEGQLLEDPMQAVTGGRSAGKRRQRSGIRPDRVPFRLKGFLRPGIPISAQFMLIKIIRRGGPGGITGSAPAPVDAPRRRPDHQRLIIQRWCWPPAFEAASPLRKLPQHDRHLPLLKGLLQAFIRERRDRLTDR